MHALQPYGVSLGFVFFVANLQKGQYQFQMAQYCYTHMALLLIVVQSHFIVENILEGMIWLVEPQLFVYDAHSPSAQVCDACCAGGM